MNNLKQIQEYNRQKIICAVHGTDDYEEALEKELGLGCKIELDDKISIYNSIQTIFTYLKIHDHAKDLCIHKKPKKDRLIYDYDGRCWKEINYYVEAKFSTQERGIDNYCQRIKPFDRKYSEPNLERKFTFKKIIGKPLTLDRVLLVLENSFEGEDGCFGLNFHHGLFDSWWITLSKSGAGVVEQWICKWDLTKPTLEEQTEETQRAIYKLLGGE